LPTLITASTLNIRHSLCLFLFVAAAFACPVLMTAQHTQASKLPLELPNIVACEPEVTTVVVMSMTCKRTAKSIRAARSPALSASPRSSDSVLLAHAHTTFTTPCTLRASARNLMCAAAFAISGDDAVRDQTTHNTANPYAGTFPYAQSVDISTTRASPFSPIGGRM
jgi:hypothetical protein